MSPNDWIKGKKEAKNTLIEYSDFQCPACGLYYPLLKQLSREFGENMMFVYRHFPLQQHKNAKPAAYASEAAGKQDKFWEMHDLIFENQDEWSAKSDDKAKEIFIKYAGSLNLNIEKFKNDLNLEEINKKVESDFQSGLKLKVNATPTFFLNGEKLQNPRSYDELKNIIQQTIQTAS
ncbi:MAG: hypothetical protein A3H02_02030 [Candidatus Niyogibacteria bacterium RIFCSPLOWO2_12_FULL_41_13]|uniref:Thioredoxin domain-containing protein n=1 Tax=Candidatus Niyogibacteria bacterium RIFCSPLOWO2_12_FULL_41_13 TaxID=1801726 RepID=A0A1G2F419_9BACT|nr:MAG: hypothetical protein A3H02_02030 [Candidatus Niyogibacteria bacterium RIFCSPLOWO2_12_FULL_41_13]